MQKQCKEAKLIVNKLTELKERAEKGKKIREKDAKSKADSRKKQCNKNEENVEANAGNNNDNTE